MYITISDRSSKAPFDFRAADQKPGLFPQNYNTSLQKLLWENITIKNYCTAANLQSPIQLRSLPGIPKIQEDVRNTAALYLDHISTTINNAYDTANFYCIKLRSAENMLMDAAKKIDTKEGKEKFKNLLAFTMPANEKIESILKKLTNPKDKTALPWFRKRIETDVRAFKALNQKALQVETVNKRSIEKLNREIAGINDDLNKVNKQIVEMGILVGIGSFAFIVSLAVSILTVGLICILSIGLFAGTAIAATNLTNLRNLQSGYLTQLNTKNKALNLFQDENKIIVNLLNQINPLITNGEAAAHVTQTLYEAWSSFSQNFKSLNNSILDSTEINDPARLSLQLDFTFRQLGDIEKTIQTHKTSKLIIEDNDKLLLTSLNLPSYFSNTENEIVSLPNELFLAFARSKNIIQQVQ